MNVLERSLLGGWNYSYNYALQVELRPSTTTVIGYSNTIYPETVYIVQTNIVLPDGSSHLLRLAGQQDLLGEGYYKYSTNGQLLCPDGSPPGIDVPLKYYTTDGTFIQVTIDPSGQGGPVWSAVFPDGLRVSGRGIEPNIPGSLPALHPADQICDRNGNCAGIAQYSGSSASYTTITDALGREIRITYTFPESCVLGNCHSPLDHITQTAFPSSGGPSPLDWAVKWTPSTVGTPSALEYQCSSPSGSVGTYPGQAFTCLYSGTQWMVEEVVLPVGSNLKYKFSYGDANAPADRVGWGELTQADLPNGISSEGSTPSLQYQWMYRGTIRRDAAYDSGNSIQKKTLTYWDPLVPASAPPLVWNYTTPSTGDPTGTIMAPDGGTQTNYFLLKPSNCPSYGCANLKYRTEMPEGTVIENYWETNEPWIGTTANADKKNAYIRAQYRTLPGPLGRASAVQFDYDKNGKLRTKKEFDWTSVPRISGVVSGVPPGTPLRTTAMTYWSDNADATSPPVQTAPNAYWFNFGLAFKGAVKRSTVSGSGTTGVTDFTYDNPSTTGNVTKEARWDSTRAATPTDTTVLSRANNNAIVWDRNWSHGNLTDETDPDGQTVLYDYTSTPVCSPPYSNLYPTKITIANTLIRNYCYHYATGLMTDSWDENSVRTGYTYDPYWRLKEKSEGNGARKTTINYDDANRQVTVLSDQNELQKLGIVYQFDQFGRVWQRSSNDDAQPVTTAGTGIRVQAGERISGSKRYTVTSNPFRATSSPTDGWTRKIFDREGRLVEEGHFSGRSLPAPWGSNASSMGATTFTYTDETTQSQDPAGHVRTTSLDAWGRIASVDEGGVSKATYQYNQFDSLTLVTQIDSSTYAPPVTQTRSFHYTSLNRLLDATNPENGTTSYAYFPGGSLHTRTQPGSGGTRVTTYEIDSLKRMVSKSYTPASTPQVIYCYDGKMYQGGACIAGTRGSPDYPLSRLTGYGSQVDGQDAGRNYSQFDAFGRLLVSKQLSKTAPFSSGEFEFKYSYQADGALTSVQYPSGKLVSYTLNARSLPSTATRKASEYYAGSTEPIGYEADGQMKKMVVGPNLFTQTWVHNSRGQMTESSAQTPSNANPFLRLQLDYRASANNGNLWQQTIMTDPVNYVQYFRYDNANRLVLAAENPANLAAVDSLTCVNAGGNWCQRYGVWGSWPWSTGGRSGRREQYLTADHLGSTRVVTDGSGAVV